MRVSSSVRAVVFYRGGVGAPAAAFSVGSVVDDRDRIALSERGDEGGVRGSRGPLGLRDRDVAVARDHAGARAVVRGRDRRPAVDPRRPGASKAGPFGRPIAHGFLTLSLEPVLLDEILAVEGCGTVINYGLNKVRFPAPVPVGSRVRLHASVSSAEARADGSVEVVFGLRFEAEGSDKPVCVAESIFRYLPADDG